jgi:phosphoribosyl-AMP cyclohydrolase
MRKDNTLIIPALNAGPSIFFMLNMSDKELEEGLTLRLDFKKLRKIASGQEDVIPAIAQDAQTGEVLILGYVNELALKTAIKEKKATFWSTSRNELWIKGLTSGDFLELLEVRVNCEQNSILYKVRPAGKGACHTKDAQGKTRSGCYYRRLKSDGGLESV